MEIIKKRDIIQNVLTKWNEQYGEYSPDHKFFGGDTAASIRKSLEALDLSICDQAIVDKIMGNSSWTENVCDECREDEDALIHIGEEPDYNRRYVRICKNCLEKALALING